MLSQPTRQKVLDPALKAQLTCFKVLNVARSRVMPSPALEQVVLLLTGTIPQTSWRQIPGVAADTNSSELDLLVSDSQSRHKRLRRKSMSSSRSDQTLELLPSLQSSETYVKIRTHRRSDLDHCSLTACLGGEVGAAEPNLASTTRWDTGGSELVFIHKAFFSSVQSRSSPYIYDVDAARSYSPMAILRSRLRPCNSSTFRRQGCQTASDQYHWQRA